MNFSNSPKLIESGTKYFLKESLKNCKELKQSYYNHIVNIGLFSLFIIFLGFILYYKKGNKLNPHEKKQKMLDKEKFILDKIRVIREKNRKDANDLITNLPNFESSFEILHKKYYKI
jgi:hypothetical protein|uniref:Uncharacterized protein n=1 Tax=viral metagenome TaxID=1070528 RepID=A0A6C0BZ78_9ZZZZ